MARRTVFSCDVCLSKDVQVSSFFIPSGHEVNPFDLCPQCTAALLHYALDCLRADGRAFYPHVWIKDRKKSVCGDDGGK